MFDERIEMSCLALCYETLEVFKVVLPGVSCYSISRALGSVKIAVKCMRQRKISCGCVKPEEKLRLLCTKVERGFGIHMVECGLDRVPAKINYHLRHFNAASTKQRQTVKIRMENPRDTQTSTVFEIAPDGDLMLIVGPEEAKLHVHSMLLRAVSKPFSAMLGPDWKEGHGLLVCDGPAEILLPEDNAAAMKIVCSIIHHQNREVSRSLAAGDVLAVAVTADKYDCVQVLRFASESWLRPSRDEAGNLMLLAAAAYLFQNAQAFKEITKALILDYDGSYLTLLCKEVESAMPWKVFCKYPDDRFGNMTDGANEQVCWKSREALQG